jgi:hypothetical protein
MPNGLAAKQNNMHPQMQGDSNARLSGTNKQASTLQLLVESALKCSSVTKQMHQTSICEDNTTLRNVLALSDASIKLLRFVSDDGWGSKGVCRVISRSNSSYLVQAWDVRNSCKHNGAVLPLSAAPVGRGADGVDAMA